MILRCLSIGGLTPFDDNIREQPSEQIEEQQAHQGQQGAAGQYNKECLEIVLQRALLLVELSMNFVVGHLRCGLGMAVRVGADSAPVVYMGDGIRIVVAQHLVHGLAGLDMTVKAIGDSLTQKSGRLAVKRFTVGEYGFGGQIVPRDDLFIVMASGAHFGDISRVSDLVQPGRDVVVKSIDKFIGFVANPAPAQGDIRYAGTHRFEKRQGPVKRVFMTILARRYVIRIFFEVSLFIDFGMYTFGQILGNIFVGEFFFAGWLDNVALGQAVDFFSRLVGNLLDVRVASFAFYFGMHAFIEYIFIDVHEPEFAVFVYPAETGVLMA